MTFFKTSNLQQLCYGLLQKEASAGAAEEQCGRECQRRGCVQSAGEKSPSCAGLRRTP